MGGDCLNVGCVPSKALIAAARSAANAKRASRLGVFTGGVTVDFSAVMERLRLVHARALVRGDMTQLVTGSVAAGFSREKRSAFVFRGLAVGDLALTSLAYAKAVPNT